MDLGLENRRALVTGASRGLGRAIALALAGEGAEVVAVARDLERLSALASDAAASQGKITARVCDLADPSAIEGLRGVLQQVEVLVLNTGGPVAMPWKDGVRAILESGAIQLAAENISDEEMAKISAE